MKKHKIIVTAVCVTVFCAVFAVPCYAYIDPAATSYIIQIIAGILVACGAGIGIAWNKLKRKFKKKDGAAPAPDIKSFDDGGKKVITAEDLLDDDE